MKTVNNFFFYVSRSFKKIIWYIDSVIASLRFPIDKNIKYLGVTGTDGKTTTCFFLYEIARSCGYNPVVITTIGTKFKNEFQTIDIRSTSFLAYSIKKAYSSLRNKKFKEAIKAILLMDKKGYETIKETHRTTPLASEIRKIIRKYVSLGADVVILECTSHALDQFRLWGIKFDAIGYTNITQDHLDYHLTWENYANAKYQLTKHLKPLGSVSINYDDSRSYDFLERKFNKLNKFRKIRYYIKEFQGINQQKFFIHIFPSHHQIGKSKENFDVNQLFTKSVLPRNFIDIVISPHKHKSSLKCSIKINGKFNLYNALLAFSMFYSLAPDKSDCIIKGIKQLKYVEGRMEKIYDRPTIIIDFAHTPNGMQNVLSNIKATMKKGKLWVIFGCTGERDKEKRPLMGEIAYTYADRIIITLDDSRNENTYEINSQIIDGIKSKIQQNKQSHKLQIITPTSTEDYVPYKNTEKLVVRFDEPSPQARIKAIEFAIKNANEEDTIAILGKGHEKTILIGNIDYPWSDKAVVLEIIQNTSKNSSK